MTSAENNIRILRLQHFDAAFPVAPGEEEEVQRRFATLFAQDERAWRGGGSKILKVRNVQGETFALKRLNVRRAEEQQRAAGLEAAFREEYRMHRAVSGLRGFSEVFGFGTCDGAPAIVMEWVEGCSLHDAMRKPAQGTSRADAQIQGPPLGCGSGHAASACDGTARKLEGAYLESCHEGMRGVAPEPSRTAPGPSSTATRDALEPASLLPLEVIADLGIAVLEILEGAAALDGSFAHRDLSPRNIMLRAGRTSPEEQLRTGAFDICLVDFGSASLAELGGADVQDPTFTASADVWRMGTPAYAPPEMLSADIALPQRVRRSPAVDVYALCSVLYELYAGHTPFDITPGSTATPYRLKTETAPALLATRKPDGGALAGALMAGLAADPARRPSVTQMKTALQNWKRLPAARSVGALPSGGASSTAPDRSMWQPAYARRAVTRRALLAAGILCAGAVAAGFVLSGKKPGRAAQVDPSRYATTTVLYEGEPLFKALDGARPGWMLCTADGAIACKPASSRECGALRGGLVALFDDASGLYGYITPLGGADAPIVPASAINVADGSGSSIVSDANAGTNTVGGSGTSGEGAGKDIVNGIARQNVRQEPNTMPAASPTAAATANATGYAWYILPTFAQVQDFSEGLAAAQDPDSKLWGYIDPGGTWVIAARYRAACAFSNGAASVLPDSAEDLWGAIDATGAWDIEPRFAALGSRSPKGFAIAQDADSSWGFADSNGDWASDARFPSLRRLGSCEAGGITSAKKATHVEGAALPCELSPALDAGSGLWGYVDIGGSWAVKPVFMDARPFSEGLAAVQDARSQLWYFIDGTGQAANNMAPSFWKLGDLHDGLAPAQATAEDSVVVFDDADPSARSEFAGRRYGYVDAAGRWHLKRLTTLVDTALANPASLK